MPIDDCKFSLISLIYFEGAGVFWFVCKNLIFLDLKFVISPSIVNFWSKRSIYTGLLIDGLWSKLLTTIPFSYFSNFERSA
jgi:hypothetical protein